MMRWATLVVLAMALGACVSHGDLVGDGSGFGADAGADSGAQADATPDAEPGLDFGYGEDGRCYGVFIPALGPCREDGCPRCECDSEGRPVLWESGSFCEEQRDGYYESAAIEYDANGLVAGYHRRIGYHGVLVDIGDCVFADAVELNIDSLPPECEWSAAP